MIEVLFRRNHGELSGRGLHAGAPSSCPRTLKRHECRAPAAPIALALLGLLALIVSGCKPVETHAAAKKPETPVLVKLVQPARGDIVRSISLPAIVAANQQATLHSKVAGYLKAIHVDKGDEVKKGQLLAEIEVPELLAELARYQAEAEIAELDYKRAVEAHKRAPDLIVAQTVDTAKAKSLMAKANLERAETLLGFCRITAPFAGIVTRRTVDPGAFIPAGNAAQNAAVVTLMDFNTVRVQVAVPEPEVPLIRNGVSARVVAEQLPGRVFEGSVTRFSQALDDSTKTMLTEIDLPNPKRELRPGMFATVKLGIEQRSNVLAVPVEAVLFEKSGTSVFVLAEGKAKKVRVKTGFNDGARVEILEGIGAAEAVILPGKTALANGQAVNIAEGE